MRAGYTPGVSMEVVDLQLEARRKAISTPLIHDQHDLLQPARLGRLDMVAAFLDFGVAVNEDRGRHRLIRGHASALALDRIWTHGSGIVAH